MDFPRLIGIIGLLLISIGVLQRRYKLRDHIFIAGSVFLFAYSIAIEDVIFAVLQLIFIGSSLYDLNRTNRSSYTPPPSLPKNSSPPAGGSEHFASVPGGVVPERSKR